MTVNFNYLFQMLEKEDITIDKAEFEFQIQSHPDYPSLLSIADTLSFFNIDNGVVRIAISDIELLPDRFVTLLKEEESEDKLYFIEKKGAAYFCFHDKKTVAISKSELESRWCSIVLLAEKPINEVALKSTKNSWSLTLPLLAFLLLVLVLATFQIALSTKLFLLFPIVGLLFSIAALKDLFGAKSELLNSFCNMTASTSCNSIVNSSKWKIFEIVNFSDLSMVFFGFQFIGLFFSILTSSTDSLFTLQKILLVFAVPVIFASLYYQKYVEKKWCPICLVIISIIFLELGYLLVFQNVDFTIDVHSLLLNGLFFISVLIAWLGLKKILTSQKELKEFQFKGSRFMRNYDIFKNNLLISGKTELSDSPILLGSKESQLEIALITSPFCGYCKEAHEILEKIALTYKDNLKVKIIINADMDSLDEEKKTFFRTLMSIYLQKGEFFFLEALTNWFVNKDLKKWLDSYKYDYDNEKIDSIYKQQNQWCIDNNSYLTPSIFINGYRYPKTYEREYLKFFIEELIEDEDFQ